MDSKGVMKSDNNNKKGEVGNNNKGVINRDVCVCCVQGSREEEDQQKKRRIPDSAARIAMVYDMGWMYRYSDYVYRFLIVYEQKRGTMRQELE